MNITHIIIICISLFSCFECFAKTDCVVIYEKTGAETLILLKDMSEISFTNNLIHIGEHEFFLDKLIRYEFADSNNAGISEIEGDLSNLRIDSRGIIEFSTDVNDISVYDLKGNSCHFIRNGNKIDITGLPKEIYLIKIGKTSFKLLKK